MARRQGWLFVAALALAYTAAAAGAGIVARADGLAWARALAGASGAQPPQVPAPPAPPARQVPPDTGPLTRAELVAYARSWPWCIDGDPSERSPLSRAVDRFRRDPVAAAYFAAVLEGREPRPPGASTEQMLFFLAHRADPRYVPLMLRYVPTDAGDLSADRMAFGAAAHYLAQHAAVPAARRRLSAIAWARRSDRRRAAVVFQLLYSRAPAARAILARTPLDGLPPMLSGRLRARLAEEAGGGRHPEPPT